MFCWSFRVYHSFLPFQSYVVKERYWVKTVLLQQHVLLYCKTNKCIFSSVRERENILILEASVALGLHLIAAQLNLSASHRCRCIYFKLHIDYDEGKGTNKSVRKGKQHTSFVFWLVVLQEIVWCIWINFWSGNLLLEERKKEPPECRWSSPGEQCRSVMEFPVWEVPEYYSKNECLWKQKGKEKGHNKRLGYVDRNESY